MPSTQKSQFSKVEFAPFVDFTQFADQFKLPAVDTTAVIDAQRKNIEAFSAANKVAFEGFQAVAQRQAEIVRKSFEDAASAVNELTTAGKPEVAFAKQAELVKQGYAQAVANGRELLEMSAKSNGEAVEVINKRVTEGLDELTVAVKKLTNGK
ncbi:MAG: phasin family protein [Pseudomonadota bacterium]